MVTVHLSCLPLPPGNKQDVVRLMEILAAKIYNYYKTQTCSKQKNYFSFQNPALRGIACLKKAMITGMDNLPEA